MALMITNIGLAALLNPTTNALVSTFSRMDAITLDIDGKMTPVHGGPSGYAVVNITADRNPKVSVKGPEVPLSAATALLGANTTAASVGAPVQIPMLEQFTIPANGTVTLPNGNAISATATSISVQGALDGKLFSGVASAPTAGQYVNPTGGATTITFNTGDAGKTVYISYTMDSTTGGKIDVMSNSVSGVYKFIAPAKVINTEDPAKLLVPITFIVTQCQFIGNWQVSQERQKASATSLDLSILDPGGTTPAVQIVTAAKFAG